MVLCVHIFFFPKNATIFFAPLFNTLRQTIEWTNMVTKFLFNNICQFYKRTHQCFKEKIEKLRIWISYRLSCEIRNGSLTYIFFTQGYFILKLCDRYFSEYFLKYGKSSIWICKYFTLFFGIVPLVSGEVDAFIEACVFFFIIIITGICPALLHTSEKLFTCSPSVQQRYRQQQKYSQMHLLFNRERRKTRTFIRGVSHFLLYCYRWN